MDERKKVEIIEGKNGVVQKKTFRNSMKESLLLCMVDVAFKNLYLFYMYHKPVYY